MGDVLLAHLNHPDRAADASVVAGILALKACGFRFVRLDGAMPSARAPAVAAPSLPPSKRGARLKDDVEGSGWGEWLGD